MQIRVGPKLNLLSLERMVGITTMLKTGELFLIVLNSFILDQFLDCNG